MEKKLISFDVKAQFGFLKKPDINEGIYLTYTCIHKPALLGILGAIVGLGGHYQSYVRKKPLPEYYEKLGNVRVGIQPLNSFKGNYTKTIITYNNSVGYANHDGGTLIISEQTIINPSFRIYLMLNISNEYEKKLYANLSSQESEFIPYLGKNDFQLWWENFHLYGSYGEFRYDNAYRVETIFLKEHIVKQIRESAISPRINLDSSHHEPFFIFFERLPTGFSSVTSNYELQEFAYTNYQFPKDVKHERLFYVEKDNQNVVMQLN